MPDRLSLSEQVRPRVDDELLLSLTSHLTERDRYLVDLLGQHKVLTTVQVTDIGFTSTRRTEIRLAQLRALRVVDRFRPFTTVGSAPFHWILDTAGTHVLAADRGKDPRALHPVQARAVALAGSQRLGHLVGMNGFFTALVRTSRTHPGASLLRWWSEARCATEWGVHVRPDGHGIWQENDRRVPFLLEYDTGTEPLGRLAAKLPGYTRLAQAANTSTWVLFAFRTHRREASARDALANSPVPVATAVVPDRASPAEAIWLPTNDNGPRRRLVDLGPTLDRWEQTP